MTGPIDLSRAPDFKLSALDVRPATREILADGSREVLQPRIMQVLVALNARVGEVVSRDDLVRLCWDSQVVGDDAINRCIAKLRQVGEAHEAFRIATIARVGYRLEECLENQGAQTDTTPVLAVLPFENLSSDPEMQFFSDGISEEILTAMTRVTGLRVIASTSSFSFRGSRKAEAARALGASYLIDGSVRRGGSRVRIAAQLSQTSSGEVLWSEHYDREMADVLALQDEIAALTANALSAQLAPAAPSPQIDPQAYDLYLRALSIRRSLEAKAQEKAISYLQAAVAIEPDFARAHAALSYTLCQRIVAATVMNAAPEAFDAAVAGVRAQAVRALALDPTNAEAQAALLSLQPSVGAWREHEVANIAALASAPNEPLLLTSLARLLFGMGRIREAYALHERAYACDPLSPRAMAYAALRRDGVSGNLTEARALVDRAYELAPRDPIVWRIRSVILSYGADWAEALKMLETGADVGQTQERMQYWRASYQFTLAGGRHEDNPGRYNMHLLLRRSPFVLGALVFGLTVVQRNYDAAFDLIDEGIRIHTPERLWCQWNTEGINVAPTTMLFTRRNAALRQHPRFLPLCAKLGLCEYWTTTGHWPDFIVDAEDRGEFEARVREFATSR